jgi:hypothetical protein
MRLTALLFLMMVSSLASSAQTKDIESVKSILLAQQSDWNHADIDAFMEAYWKSEELQFVGSSGVLYGWDATMARYKRNYPTPEKMGRLTFDILQAHQLSKKVIFLTGKYTLERKNDRPTGYFTLTWRKIKGRWLIVADHTSASE